jgi:5-methylcytosine-specific restriction endonuclease McrA
MKRKRITTRDRLRLFEEKRGICHHCGGKVQAGQAWDLSHVIPLEAGGEDEWHNYDVIHRDPCHRQRTAKIDAPVIAKVRRIRANHLGAKTPTRNPLPGSRASGFKRKMDGTVVPRRSK